MKNLNVKNLTLIKDFFSILIGLELTIMFLVSPDIFKVKYLFMYLLPIGMSGLVWNKWLYDALMDDKNALYAKLNISFKTFLLIGLFFVTLATVAFATSIYRWLM